MTNVLIATVWIIFTKQQNQRFKNSRLAGVVLTDNEIDPLERFNLQVTKTSKVFYVEAF